MGGSDRVLIELAPGIWIDPLKRQDLSPRQEWVLLDQKGLARLGLGQSQMKLLERLDHAGRIEVFKITPRRKLLKLSSWRDHLEGVRSDPELWERPEMRRRWRLACLAI